LVVIIKIIIMRIFLFITYRICESTLSDSTNKITVATKEGKLGGAVQIRG
jgi:hypothetical protein